jgi:hypothetical protein
LEAISIFAKFATKRMKMENKQTKEKEQPKKVNKTWEAAGRLKGALYILDPQLQL